MKSKLSLLTIILFLIFSTSCVNEKFIAKKYQQINNKSIGIIKPISKIDLIEEKNTLTSNDSLSKNASELLFNQIIEISGNEKNKKEILVDNKSLAKIYNQFFKLETKLKESKGKYQKQLIIDSFKMSETLKNLMEENKIDQLIITYQEGFSRTKTNYRTQNLKSLGVGLATLGTIIPVTFKSSSVIYAWVLDSETGKLEFRNVGVKEIEPLNPKDLSIQVCELFEGFYSYRSNTGSCFHY